MPSPACRSDCGAAPILQTTTTAPPIDWRLISAADRPIVEDTWIASVLQDEVQRLRWRDWYEQPRYAVALNVGPWAVLVVAFRPKAGDNPLLDLLMSINANHRAAAWAVSKSTRQIYRLAVPLPQEHLATVDTPALLAAAEPNLRQRRQPLPQIPPGWAASRRWHAVLAEAGIPPEDHGGQRFAERGTPPWLPLLERAFRVGDVQGAVNASEQDVTDPATDACGLRTVRFLNTRQMLDEEADLMQHCVSTYLRRCVTGRWHIASLADANGGRCSTASFQMSFAQGRWSVQLVEHRGLRNAPPSARCVQSLRTVEALLNKQVMQHRFVEIELARVKRAAVSRELRFNGSTRGQDVSLAALRAALPMDVFNALVGLPC